MDLKLSGIVIHFILIQLEKALFSMLSKPSDKTTFPNLLQSSNA